MKSELIFILKKYLKFIKNKFIQNIPNKLHYSKNYIVEQTNNFTISYDIMSIGIYHGSFYQDINFIKIYNCTLNGEPCLSFNIDEKYILRKNYMKICNDFIRKICRIIPTKINYIFEQKQYYNSFFLKINNNFEQNQYYNIDILQQKDIPFIFNNFYEKNLLKIYFAKSLYWKDFKLYFSTLL